MNNIPNRKERRKIAKKMSLFGKNKSTKAKTEKSRRSLAMGNLIRLSNLTEQRNRDKNINQED